MIGAATAFSLLADQTSYSTLPVFFEELGLRPIEVGVILSASRWIRLGTNELAHRVQGFGHHRGFFVAAVGLGAVRTAVSAATPGFAVFVAARLVWGLCWSFIRHLGVLSVMAVTAQGQAGHAAGRLGGISRIGSVALGPVRAADDRPGDRRHHPRRGCRGGQPGPRSGLGLIS